MICHNAQLESSRLKSNMDRFIERNPKKTEKNIRCLKSNMDRFIEFENYCPHCGARSLKSNMDRFIDDYRISKVQATAV